MLSVFTTLKARINLTMTGMACVAYSAFVMITTVKAWADNYMWCDATDDAFCS